MDMVDKTKTKIFEGKTHFSGGERNSSFRIRDPSLTPLPYSILNRSTMLIFPE
jgi:hypothetical protein